LDQAAASDEKAFYTVTIPELDLTEAKKLCALYEGAKMMERGR